MRDAVAGAIVAVLRHPRQPHDSDSVLSKHLSALAGAGYVEVSRVRADSRSRRQVTLTRAGRTALRGHLAALQAIAAAAEPADTEEPSERHQPGRQLVLDPGIA
jgi:DNA-binding PadR family transcriptional regulator